MGTRFGLAPRFFFSFAPMPTLACILQFSFVWGGSEPLFYRLVGVKDAASSLGLEQAENGSLRKNSAVALPVFGTCGRKLRRKASSKMPKQAILKRNTLFGRSLKRAAKSNRKPVSTNSPEKGAI